MLDSALAGLLTGLTLIVAIGAQNAYVLQQGVLRRHVGPVVAICTVSDIVLILAGVGGIGTIVDHAGWLLTAVRWGGVAFLVWYAAGALRRARHAESLTLAAAADVPLRSVATRAVALTWLNPHVYLDTVVLVGSIAAAHATADGEAARWWFALGACLASAVWFIGLGFGARLLAPVLARPRPWRVLEVLIAVTMLWVAWKLARDA